MARWRKGPKPAAAGQTLPVRLMAVLVALFLLQYVSWIVEEDGVWMDETVELVKWAIGITAAAYFIPRIPRWVRIAIQLAAIIAANAIYLDYRYIEPAAWKWSFMGDYALANVLQFVPFIWFSLGAWVLFQAAMALMSRQAWMYMILLGTIVAFCIRDSFSNLSLWQEVSTLLFISVLILVVSHMMRLQRKSPEAWTKLARKPFPILIPILALAVIFYGIVSYAPPVRPVLVDPYTAWMEAQGQTVARFVDEDGVFPTLANPLNNESGYSRSDGALGGGFQFNYEEVMKVDASQRAYWRGETRSVYTGKGWERGPDERTDGFAPVKPNEPLPQTTQFDASKAKTKEITAAVTMKNEVSYPVLFGASGATMLASIEGKDNPVGKLGWSEKDGVLHYAGKSDYPTKFTIHSQSTVLDFEGLRSVRLEDIDQKALYSYLELPEKTPPRVRALAATITQNAATPYDKVKTIERYLAETYKYTNTPGKGTNEDFVYQFLFEVKEGYCDYFSTAMAVLTRAIGMPSRWVKGFSSGSSDMDEAIERGLNRGVLQQESLNGQDTYTVRNSDAHSWVEVYFPGYGWIPFEPTSGFSLPTVYDGQSTPLDETTLPLDLPEDIGVETAGGTWQVWAFGAAITVAIAVAAFVIYRYVPWWRLRKWVVKRRRADNFNQALLVDFQRWLRFAKRKGYHRHEHETMRETLTRWMKDSRWMKDDLDLLLRQFERAKYAGVALTESEWNAAGETMRKIKSAMK